MKKSKRNVIALDIGDKRIGIAVSDPLFIISQAYENYSRKTTQKDIAHIIDLIIEREANCILYGLPYNMDGSIGFQAEKTMHFIKLLKKKIHYTNREFSKDIDFISIDERLSSVDAEAILIEADISRKKRKNKVDMLAAQIFLENFIEKINNKN